MQNLDEKTVAGFGVEWSRFDQAELSPEEHQRLFSNYFDIFPWSSLPAAAEGFDLGCGSGRWAKLVAPRVGKLHCVDASAAALAVARRNLAGQGNCEFDAASVDSLPLADGSMDFGYSLGVLHHVPDTGDALRDCVRKLKPGAPFLLYLYYAFDNQPSWYRALWQVSDVARRTISRLPSRARIAVTSAIAAGVYFPLARAAKIAERVGLPVSSMPLSFYRRETFYTMRTDALDRFGTRLEQRFTRAQIHTMMTNSGLVDIRFSDSAPFWVAMGRRSDG